MNKMTRIAIMAAFAAVIVIAWFFIPASKTAAQKQLDLIQKADLLMSDGIYISAVPILEEAAGYDGAHTLAAEERLKRAYSALSANRGFARKYSSLLDKQMGRPDAMPEVFAEAALHQLSINARQNALAILRTGIEKTANDGLVALYESERYAYDMNRVVFEEVTAIYNQTLQVRQDGKWGIADTDGNILIPCGYDKISTFDQNCAIVRAGDAIYAVDQGNNRIAVAPPGTRDFRNLAEDRTALLSDSGWRRAGYDFELGKNVFEDVGMYSGGYAAAMTGGRWGVIGVGNDWLIPAEYDEIVQDELGRCFAQGAVFVRSGEEVYLFSNGELLNGTYQDARPFSDEGYAAICRNGKWGFTDTGGNIVIGCEYDDALSFGGHLAAVKRGDSWGYVSVSGDMVIDAVFRDAKSFAGGCAPVLTDKGWQLITLAEFKKERTL